MIDVDLSREQKEQLVAKLKRYFEDELDQDIGGFEAEFLLDFIGKELGAFYYNKGVSDAQLAVASKYSELTDLFFELEQTL
ncbi:DUF2164 domain-containing protein [Salinibius halmophilus]|uniref:DUF2164 domain-containing protein n=1 Tax=Salinibius halmophilus TaxID=1853216 RepID=UPI000E661906|nr:DUF2164 domain-containing protein [Salinibius halmophilus]